MGNQKIFKKKPHSDLTLAGFKASLVRGQDGTHRLGNGIVM